MSQNHLEHFPQKGVQRLVSANPIPPIPLPCARRSSAPGHVQVHAPPQQGMFQKQFLAVSSPPSAVAATANQHPQPLQSSLLSVTRPAPGWGSRLTPCQSKPPNPETSLGSAQAHYYFSDAPGDPESLRIKSITLVFHGELRCAKSGPPNQPDGLSPPPI